MLSIKPNNKFKSGFSLLELTVALGITGIIMVMLSNVLVTSVGISQKALARSFVREEIAQITESIASDIRAATEIGQCEGTIDDIYCEITLDDFYTWEICPTPEGVKRVCKKDKDGNPVFVSSANIDISTFTIERGFEQLSTSSSSRRNLLVTVAADHVQEGLEIENVYNQTSISTRNYLLTVSSRAKCGNGRIDLGETCDDGNTIDGDGCDSTCVCQKTRETVSLRLADIPRSSGGCTFSSSPVNRTYLGYNLTEVSNQRGYDLLSINKITVRSTNSRRLLGFSDPLIFTLNDVVIVFTDGDKYPLLRDSGTLKLFSDASDFALLEGRSISWFSRLMCIGGNPYDGGRDSTCRNTSTKVWADVPELQKQELVSRINQEDVLRMGRWVFANSTRDRCSAVNMSVTIDAEIEYGCTCGNGVVDYGEACDDGNPDVGDGCRPDCTVESCGDGILDPQDDCEPSLPETFPGNGRTCNASDCSIRKERGVKGDCVRFTCPEDAPYLIGCYYMELVDTAWNGVKTYERKNRLEVTGSRGTSCVGTNVGGDIRKTLLVEGIYCPAGQLEGVGICSSRPNPNSSNGIACGIEYSASAGQQAPERVDCSDTNDKGCFYNQCSNSWWKDYVDIGW